MDRLISKVRKNIQSHGLLKKGDAVLVAVSGGVDSMVLLDVLRQLAEPKGFTVSVAHFNHQLRGRAADQDERLVQRYCELHALGFEAGRGDVKALARTKKISLEMAARELRLAFLREAARQAGCQQIAMAHHADDQVELFFIRLFRGSGGEGVAGMDWSANFPGETGLRLVRPLLDLAKARLILYAAQHGVPHREDATNRDTEILRNRIRKKLLPQIAALFGDAALPAIVRTMEITGAEAEFAATEASAWLAAKKRRKTFGRLPVALQRQIIRRQLWTLGVAESFELIEELRTGPEATVQLNPQAFLCRRADGMVEKSGPREVAFRPNALGVALKTGRGDALFDSLTITWEKEKITGRFVRPQRVDGLELFDAERVGEVVRLRYWRPGDRFQPLGMSQPVKLQDWFVNQKVPLERRRQLVVAETADGRIFWVEGQRIGEQFKLDKGSRHRLKWQWQSTLCPR